jgi:hypothetical protein
MIHYGLTSTRQTDAWLQLRSNLSILEILFKISGDSHRQYVFGIPPIRDRELMAFV